MKLRQIVFSRRNIDDFVPGANVGDTERVVSGFAGVICVIEGAKQRSIKGLIAAALGYGLLYRAVTGHSYLFELLKIDTAGKAHPANRSLHIEKSVVVQRPLEGVYRYWRRLENWPQFLSQLHSIKEVGDKLSVWAAKGPLGKTVEWAVELINEVPNEVIAWQSLPDDGVYNAGSVRFRPVNDGRSTEVRVVMDYKPRLGRLSEALASALGKNPAQQIENDLMRMKHMLELETVPA